MIVVVCTACALAVRIMPTNIGDVRSTDEAGVLVGPESSFWPNKFPCPRCEKDATGMLERHADPRALALMTLRDLTPHEAFAAFNGLGFPEEQKCSIETLQELLREQPVRRVIGKDIVGAPTVHIDAIELWDGTRVHFGSGTSGAVVYRIVRPPAYAHHVLVEGTPS